MILSEFLLPKEFYVKDKVLSGFLKKLWNTEYSELYDNEYFDKSNDCISDLESDIEILLDAFVNPKENKFREKSLLLGNVMCMACFPHLKATLSNSQIKWFELFLGCLENNTNLSVSSQPSIDDLPGSSSEAAMVFFQMANLEQQKDYKNSLLDMLDSCIPGSGICPGSLDKRAIFNWFLVDVFPCIYYLKKPDFIYTIKTCLPENWKYNKA